MTVVLVAVLALSQAPPPPAPVAPGPYAGLEERSLKALAPDEVASLLAGEGMGMAKAAELNHYPGPRHVLDLRDRLGLSAEQVRAIQLLYDDMHAQAVRVGTAIVEAERALDAALAGGALDRDGLRREVAHIALRQGELRAIHLEAHLATRAVLSAEQVALYDRLRGYGAAGQGGHEHVHPH